MRYKPRKPEVGSPYARYNCFIRLYIILMYAYYVTFHAVASECPYNSNIFYLPAILIIDILLTILAKIVVFSDVSIAANPCV